MKLKRLSLPKKITVSGCAALLALALTDGQRPLRAQLLGDTSLNSGNYSGQATVINITDVHAPIPGPIVICDTGPLPPSGGFLQASVMVLTTMVVVANCLADVLVILIDPRRATREA